MSIKNRLNRFIKEQKKKARKKYLARQGFLAQKPITNRERRGKMRALDGTMR